MSADARRFGDILDEDVYDELEDRVERTLGPRAIADGVDLGYPMQLREWVRRLYEAGDPEMRDAVDLMALDHSFDDFHEPPYFWGCLTSVENRLTKGNGCLQVVTDLDDVQVALDEACADEAVARGADIYRESSLHAWLKAGYAEGDAAVRRALLAEALQMAIHGHGVDYREPMLPSCKEYFVPDHLMGVLSERGAYVERAPRYDEHAAIYEDDEGEDLEWDFSMPDFLGRFTSSGNDYEVWNFIENDGLPRRFHLRRPRSPRQHDVCVCIYEPLYVDEGTGRIGLTEREIADFIDFLRRNGGSYYGEDGREMPDYTRLHWPEEA